ncbi:MAG: 50S ribosomal protein L31e [Nanoarchaeota archaeon]
MATIQRTYTIPLRKDYVDSRRWKRSKKAVGILRIFLEKHTKRDVIKIGPELNKFIWKHGIKNPPSKVKVDVWIEDELAKAELSGIEYQEAVKPEKKEKGESLKDKLAAKLGVGKEGKEEKKEEEEPLKKTAGKKDEMAAAEKKEVEKPLKEAKKEIKKEEKKTDAKKSEPQKSVKEKKS